MSSGARQTETDSLLPDDPLQSGQSVDSQFCEVERFKAARWRAATSGQFPIVRTETLQAIPASTLIHKSAAISRDLSNNATFSADAYAALAGCSRRGLGYLCRVCALRSVARAASAYATRRAAQGLPRSQTMEQEDAGNENTTRNLTASSPESSPGSTAPKSVFDGAANRIEASISSDNRTQSSTEATDHPKTSYAGLSLGLVTAAGGHEVSAGLFMNSRGAVGDYFSQGPAFGYLAAVSACVVIGRSDAFEGRSISTSLAKRWLSGSTSHDPATGELIGGSVSACLSLGQVGASVSSTETYTSEFSAPQRIYREILEFVGYPAAGSVPNGLY